MTGGYTGKILRVNLSTKSTGTIPTEKYEAYGGGHGMGSAIFFDLVGEQLPYLQLSPPLDAGGVPDGRQRTVPYGGTGG